MAQTTFTIQEMLSFTPLTEAVKLVASGIPKLLPAAFYNTRETILGNKARHFMMKGTRKAARVVPYGAPPRQVVQLPLETEDLQLIHTIEELNGSTQQLLGVAQSFERYEAQVSYRDELNRQAQEFGIRFSNLETAAIMSMVANGKIWFDADGNILPTSSGAGLTVDYAVPANNTGSINGLVTAPWSTTSTDIVTQLLNLHALALQTTGYPLKYAFFGKNVAGYLAKNTTFQQYLARNPGYNQQYLNTGSIAQGTLDLTWVPVQAAFFEDDSGNVQTQFPDDQVTFTPEINSQTYALYEGSYRVPKTIQPMVNGDLMDALTSTELVYGMFRFAQVALMPIAVKQTTGHTFLPKMKQPSAWFYMDTTP